MDIASGCFLDLAMAASVERRADGDGRCPAQVCHSGSFPVGRAGYARLDMSILLIGAGGFAGAIARYVVDGAIADRTGGGFPWGTLAVNLSGSFLLGFLFALTAERAILPADIRGPIMIGFIGAYTTFSTWMLESWRLIEGGSYLPALANLGGSVVLGLIAVFAGLVIGRAI